MNGRARPTTGASLSRRSFLQAGAAAGIAAFLAACGASNQSRSPASGEPFATNGSSAPSGGIVGPSGSAGAATRGELNFANKIGYIDLSDDGSTYPSLDEFKKRTGISVNYDEPIEDDEGFVSSNLQAPLSQGQPTPWDLVVLSDWMVARLARLGWLEAIDPAATPNLAKNLLPAFRGRAFDRDTRFAAPWSAGMTGIGFDRKKTGDVRSLDALWDSRYKGQITFLQDSMRDTVGLAALKLGVKPETMTTAQFDRAVSEIRSAKSSGLLHDLAGDSYVDVLAGGDAVIGMAYSADVLTLLVPGQTEEQDFHFTVPAEGGMLWADNLCIPKGAPNKRQAETFIDFYYDPTIAATVAMSVKFISPVKGVADIVAKKDAAFARNPLAFPPPDVLGRLHQFRSLDQSEETAWNTAFSKLFGT
jgi:spermidine/putrescine transport system substrate-binding protein